MHSCVVVVVNDSVSKDDVTYAVKPAVQLRATPVGNNSKQIVRTIGDGSLLAFTVFDATTSFPVMLSGMAIFFTVHSKDGEGVISVKGRTTPGVKNVVYFQDDSFQGMAAGFYSYDLTVRAADEYSQTILSGSYVVKN
jgi:hypothetical protein